MFKIQNGRPHFYQWDLGQRLIVPSRVKCDQVHFYNKTRTTATVCDVYEVDGQRLVDVPDNLLQVARPLVVSAYVCNGDAGRFTQVTTSFFVYARPKPENYVSVKWNALVDANEVAY